MAAQRYRVNSPHVINEIIDGEAVIIHLGTGNYFSLGASGADVWSRIEQSARVDEIVDTLGALYDGSHEQITAAVEGLVEQLHNENLIVPEDGGAASVPSNEAPAAERTTFQPPTLEKFTDMQDLILLDPVHEVDERGWPNAAPRNVG